ncbi:MAG: helix-turn-helix domain-containing protein [Vicinamibacteria bacterium]
MNYRTYAPPPALRPFVRALWSLEGRDPAPAADRIFPDGCMELVVHLGAPFSAWDDDGHERIQPAAFLVGQMTQALRVRPSGRAAVVGVRFQPGGAWPFLRVPQHELYGRRPALAELGPALAGAALRMHDEGGVEAAVARLTSELLDQARRVGTPDRRVSACVAAIERSAGAVTVDALAHGTGVGARQLERLFRDTVGLAPKTLARLARFQAALRACEAGAPLPTTALAAGYADQAHFTREFRRVAGITPSRFLAERAPLASAFADVGFVQDAAAGAA